jgi:mannose-6-phosphate isomerase-like protein (cupin superfamily)
MREQIRHLQPQAEYYFVEGCYINELLNAPDDTAVSIARARVAPGVATRWHRLRDIVERYVIVAGRGRVEIGDLPGEEVRAGAVVLIPPLCRQRIINTGDEDLVFLAICSPRFRPEAYEDIEG